MQSRNNQGLVRRWHDRTGNQLDLPDVLAAPDERPTELVVTEEAA